MELDRAKGAVASSADASSNEAETKTDDQIIADFKQRLEKTLELIEKNLEDLEKRGEKVPEGLRGALEKALGDLEKTLERLETDEAFRKQIAEKVRELSERNDGKKPELPASGQPPKPGDRPELDDSKRPPLPAEGPSKEKLCEALKRLLEGGAKTPDGKAVEVPEAIKRSVQQQYQKECSN